LFVAGVAGGEVNANVLMVKKAEELSMAEKGGDAAILYCFIFLYIVFAGGGPWSVDRSVHHRD
jgi:putative oxidoreductase